MFGCNWSQLVLDAFFLCVGVWGPCGGNGPFNSCKIPTNRQCGWVLGRCLTTTLGGNGQDVSFLFVRWALFVLWACMGLIVLQSGKISTGGCRLRRASWPVPVLQPYDFSFDSQIPQTVPAWVFDPKGMEAALSLLYLLSYISHISFKNVGFGAMRNRVSRKSKQRRWGQTAEAATEYKQTQHGGASRMTYLPKVFFGIANVFRKFFLCMLAFQSKSDICLSKLQTFVETKFRRVWRGKFYCGGHGTLTTSGRSSGSSIVAKRLGSGGARNVGCTSKMLKDWMWIIPCVHDFSLFKFRPRRTWIYCRRSSIFLKWFEQA